MLKQVKSTVSLSIEAHDQAFERMSQQLAIIINQTSVSNLPWADSGLIASITSGATGLSTAATSNRERDDVTISGFGDSVASGPRAIESESGGILDQECPAWCSCRCHQRRVFKSPWILDSVLGTLQIHFTGGRPDCSEYRCRRSDKAPTSILYRFPRYLLSRYVAMTMHWAVLDGPKYSLSIPRVTDWSHIYWNYCVQGNLEAIQKLFSAGKASALDLNLIGGNALIYNAVRGNLRLTTFLLENGADLEVKDDAGNVAGDALWKSALTGEYGSNSISIVKSMTRNIESDYMERRRLTLLHKIVLGLSERNLREELELSTALLNQGDAQQRTPLCWAVIRNDITAVKALLSYNADPDLVDENNRSPLSYTWGGTVCKLLLDSGADVNIRDSSFQRTALHHLCHGMNATVECVESLVAAGLDVDVRDIHNETPLLPAVFRDHTAVAEKLIELGANINSENLPSNDNAIRFAIWHNRSDIIPLLLSRGANYRSINSNGRNIAHTAATSANTNVIEILANANLEDLDFQLQDKNGKTPFDYLIEREVLVDAELGIHEAFHRWAAQFQRYQTR